MNKDAEQSGDSARVRRWRKKPVEVEAIRYDPPHNCAAVAAFVGMVAFDCADYEDEEGHAQEPWLIDTLEGVMEASPGDFIIRGVQGEFYPCKPDIFEATYEAADGEQMGSYVPPEKSA